MAFLDPLSDGAPARLRPASRLRWGRSGSRSAKAGPSFSTRLWAGRRSGGTGPGSGDSHGAAGAARRVGRPGGSGSGPAAAPFSRPSCETLSPTPMCWGFPSGAALGRCWPFSSAWGRSPWGLCRFGRGFFRALLTPALRLLPGRGARAGPGADHASGRVHCQRLLSGHHHVPDFLGPATSAFSRSPSG